MAMPEGGDADNTRVMGQAWRLAACLASYRLEPLVFAYALSVTLIMATSQNLIMDRVCTVNLEFNSSICANITNHQYLAQENDVQRLANKFVLYRSLIEVLPSVLFTLFMGSWSDCHGRKLPLLLPIAGSILTCGVYIAFSVVKNIPAQYLLFASIPQALTGGTTVFLMASFSYLSDITGQRDRTARLGVLDVCFLAPLAVGFVTSGAAVQRVGYVPLYCASGGLMLLVLLYGALLVPESRSPQQLALSAAAAGSVVSKRNVRRIVHTCFRRRHGYNRSTILLAMLGFIAHEMTLNGESSITSSVREASAGLGLPDNLVVLPVLS
ncbi:proton-coupled folate transporter-like [Pollicipes pollicipes]|uniref:proton-coupled folate transporter-like n=1 Tax=Pollicipes pollicipes TaxID=41117 RepID=UPI001885794E|nr:proton-coupled folate transporter-like [Pollicipes pollicipes]